VRRYVVERYLPGSRPEEVGAESALLAAAAVEAAAAGEDVRYLGSMFLAEEESCFCQFEAASRDSVERVCRRAGVPFARIVEARAFPHAEITKEVPR
jgi:hypothetical protein